MIIILVVVSLSILILVHELGHFLTAKAFGVRVDEFGLGFPPKLWSKKIGETVYSVNLLPFGGFVKIYGEDEMPSETTNHPSESTNSPRITESDKFVDSDSHRSFSNRPVWQRSAIVLAGVFMNIVLGWFVLSAVFMVGSPEHLMIVDTAKNSPAQIAGIKTGDIILEARSAQNVLKDPVKSDALIGLVKNAPEHSVNLIIQRGGKVLNFDLLGRVNPPEGEGFLGVGLTEIGFPATPFFESLVRGFETSWSILKLVVFSFINFFSKIFVEPNILETIAGPVGIFSLAAQAASLNMVYLLQFMALISLNLAVLNLIPFPALDGGRFLFLIIERIKGSPISRRIQMAINAFGFVVLMLLMIIVTIKDVGRLFD